MNSEQVEKAKQLISESSNICVLTGAGVSEESGIPTFRGDDGLWKNFRSEQLATPEAFYSDPKLVWEWYDWRRGFVHRAEPNPGHLALAELEKTKPEFTLITQNIDGLHKKAGSKNVIEIHGNIWEIRCTITGVVEENTEVPLKQVPPVCKDSGEMARPNVVWFGEMIPGEVIDRCLTALESCDVLLVIGTSGFVQPAASMVTHAKNLSKPVIEINLDSTPNTGICDITIHGKSGEVLPNLL